MHCAMLYPVEIYGEMSHCQNSSKFLSFSYLMKTADVIMIFFLHTILLIILMLADKTEKYWCVNIFFIGLKPHFLAFLPVRRKTKNFYTKYLKTVIFSGILTGCIDESIIKVNVGGFSM